MFPNASYIQHNHDMIYLPRKVHVHNFIDHMSIAKASSSHQDFPSTARKVGHYNLCFTSSIRITTRYMLYFHNATK